jgi:hypothetical protein
MPRKQRFKPSRKQKPVETNATTGDVIIGHQQSRDHEDTASRSDIAKREPRSAAPKELPEA